MSPTLATVVALLEHLAMGVATSTLLGLASNALLGRFTRPDSKARLFGAAFLTSLPSQVQAVAAELAPGLSSPERIARLSNLLDAEIAAAKMGLAAAFPNEAPTRPDAPASLRPPTPPAAA